MRQLTSAAACTSAARRCSAPVLMGDSVQDAGTKLEEAVKQKPWVLNVDMMLKEFMSLPGKS